MINIRLFEFNDIEIWKRGEKYFVRYDAGAHQIVIREDEISEENALQASEGKEAAIKMLFDLQRKLELSGINPYISNI